MKTIVLLVLALACVLYGLLVLSVGSGTAFFLVWFVIGAFLAGSAILLRLGIWERIPAAARIVIISFLGIGVGIFIIIEGMILSCFGTVSGKGTASGKAPEKDLDYLLILGAQVHESGPSVVLRMRLDTARDYLMDNESTICIVSGGQGYNEPFPEAEGMRAYLIRVGIPGERILMETESENTKENMIFSKNQIDPDNDRVGIVTNNFHMFRAMKLAAKAGYKHACALPAPSSPLFLPNNLLREFLGVLKDFAAGNI